MELCVRRTLFACARSLTLQRWGIEGVERFLQTPGGGTMVLSVVIEEPVRDRRQQDAAMGQGLALYPFGPGQTASQASVEIDHPAAPIPHTRRVRPSRIVPIVSRIRRCPVAIPDHPRGRDD